MNVQLDTNVLTRLAQPAHPSHAIALSAKQTLEQRGHTLCIVPQNLYEFWAVATRPISAQGLGLTVTEAKADTTARKSPSCCLRTLLHCLRNGSE